MKKNILAVASAYFVAVILWLSWRGFFHWFPDVSYDTEWFCFLVHLIGAVLTIGGLVFLEEAK